MIEETRKHVISYLDKDVRYDGRKKYQYRDIKVETGIVKTSEGSARVIIGDTEVLAGVKFEVGEPYPDKLDEGTMMVSAELIPLSNPEYEPGPPSIEAIEFARVVDRSIRESNTIDTKKLCIKKGELVWTVIVDLVPINDAGNLFDAFALAATLALKDARFPVLEDGVINYKEKTDEKLPLRGLPVSVTVIKIKDNYIVDPLLEEEKVLDARLTISLLEDGKICALQKGGEIPLSLEDIKQMIDIADKKSEELRKYLK